MWDNMEIISAYGFDGNMQDSIEVANIYGFDVRLDMLVMYDEIVIDGDNRQVICYFKTR